VTAKKEKGKIVRHGMGGVLCPPGHPMHDWSVQTDLRRREENRGGMCLESAVNCDWLDAATRAAARTLLATWEANKRPLDDPEVEEWILQVLGYFRGCYCRGDGAQEEDWHAANLVIAGTGRGKEPGRTLTPDQHAGVHCIRRYYPDYTPTEAHFAGAYWGSKPE